MDFPTPLEATRKVNRVSMLEGKEGCAEEDFHGFSTRFALLFKRYKASGFSKLRGY